jgi:hypothetical protein
MTPEEPPAFEPSLFAKLFSVIGAFIVVSAFAAIIAAILIFCTGWSRYLYSIYGLSWGFTARCFQLSVRQGIKQNLNADTLTPDRRRILGEQLVMLEITKKFIRAELVASAILLAFELFIR